MTPNRNSSVSQPQLNRYPTASELLPNGVSAVTQPQVNRQPCRNSTVAMPQLIREPRLSCGCTPTLTKTYYTDLITPTKQTDFAVRLLLRRAPVASLPRRDESPLVLVYLKDKIKTYTVQA